MPKQSPESEAKTEPVVICHRCDKPSTHPGHVVTDGRVSKCPFIDMEITLDRPT